MIAPLAVTTLADRNVRWLCCARPRERQSRPPVTLLTTLPRNHRRAVIITQPRDNTLEAEAERGAGGGGWLCGAKLRPGLPTHVVQPKRAGSTGSASGGLAYSPCKPLRAAPTAAGTCGPGQRDGVGWGCTDLVQLGESGTTYFR